LSPIVAPPASRARDRCNIPLPRGKVLHLPTDFTPHSLACRPLTRCRAASPGGTIAYLRSHLCSGGPASTREPCEWDGPAVAPAARCPCFARVASQPASYSGRQCASPAHTLGPTPGAVCCAIRTVINALFIRVRSHTCADVATGARWFHARMQHIYTVHEKGKPRDMDVFGWRPTRDTRYIPGYRVWHTPQQYRI